MSEARAILSAVLLAAGVAAAVAAGVVRMTAHEGPRIASVRLGELVAEHAANAVRADASPEETAASARAWATALAGALEEIATPSTVLLPARAVAAGAPDITAEVRAVLEARLARGAAAPEPRP